MIKCKKFISVILTVVMILSVFSVMTFAEENTQDTCEHTTLSGQCSNCNAFIVEEGATLSLSINLAGYNIFDTEWTLEKGNAAIVDSGSDILIMMGSYYQETKEWVIIEGVTVGTDTLKLYSTGSVYTSAEIVVVPHQTHIPKTIKGTATCTSPGLSDGEVCEYCGIVITDQTEVDALGHQEEVIKGYSATCSTTGLTDGVKCSLCDKIFTAQEEIPTTDHNSYMIAGEPASCTVAGFQEYRCIDCGSTYIVTEEPTGHTYDSGKVTTKATCSSTGVKTYTCTECKATKTETIAKDSTSHTGGTTIKNAITVTCTAKGYTGDTYCKDCNSKLSSGTSIAATGHTETVVIGYAATCTKAGLTDGTWCYACKEILTERVEIPSIGHKFGKWTVATAPTVSAEGMEERACTVCGEKETQNIAKLNYLRGDINNDGNVTTADARLVLRVAAGLESLDSYPVTLEAIDMNGDGKIAPSDARTVLRKAARLE